MGLESDLRELEQFERELGAFYDWLTTTYKDDSQAAAIFFRLKTEEMAHANLLQYQRRLYQKNPALFHGMEIGTFDAEGTLEGVKILRDQTSPPPLSEAVRTAVAIEQSAAERHSRQALQMAKGQVSVLLETLSEGDQAHARALVEFGRARRYLPPG